MARKGRARTRTWVFTQPRDLPTRPAGWAEISLQFKGGGTNQWTVSGREEPQVALAWDPGLRVTEDQHSHFCTYSCLARGLAPDLAWTATAETCRGSLSLVTRERVPSPSHRHTEGR